MRVDDKFRSIRREGGRALGSNESEGRSRCESESVEVRIEDARSKQEVDVHETAR